MSLKNTIIISFTIIYFILSIVFITFQVFELKSIQDRDVDTILETISNDLKKGDIRKETVRSLKGEIIFVIWLKKNSEWIPVITDRDINVDNIKNPLNIPQSIIYFTRTYLKKIDNFEFIVWINRFAREYYIKNIFLAILILIFVYLFISFIINLIFYPIKGVNYFEESSKYSEYEEEINIDLTSNKYSEILSEYRQLWIKNYKISDDFKNNFPFKSIYELIKFGIKPEQYLKEALDIATGYFKWENATIYLKQKEGFIDIIDKKILDENLIEIPLKGDKKGDIFIPLYPFNTENIFGYLYFQWHRLNDFFIADILYFLKYIFSEDSKIIFNQKNQEEIINYLDKLLSKKNNEIAVIVFAVDNRERLKAQLKPATLEILHNKIFTRINEDYKKDYIFKIMPLSFGIISENIIKEKLIEYIEKWKNLNHTYSISSNEPDVAVTFSIGLAVKGNREIHPVVLLNEALNYLKIARNNGGNQLIFN
ncbi:MAG TPA: hypothetical protein PLE45_04790 [Spirochaetota bacterium]|nr:hypothetical protein [Spirochaetota bacterium]HOL56584.1 hypothetical protein [Spirochaetota bacterium]HPP04013.1 hypothetical protein [Spirochaetota bacterium]